jgi:hypothetical protein
VFGTRIVARFSLAGLAENECHARLARFRNDLMARLLILLYIVYPGVSVAIFGIFSCTHIKEAGWFLDADYSIVCYSKKHWGYVGAGVIWVFVYTLGIPYYFIHLLHKYHVPLLAKTYTNNAWLFEAAKLAFVRGLEQPDLTEEGCSIHGISDAHLAALYVFHVENAPLEFATRMQAGEEELPVVPVPGEKKDGSFYKRSKRLLKSASLRILTVLQRKEEEVDETARNRALMLSKLLRWCRRSGVLGLPPLRWSEGSVEGDGERRHHLDISNLGTQWMKDAPTDRAAAKSWAAQNLVLLQARAKEKVGFLFERYTPLCWYWEVVELMRKLILTSILALVAPGSAGQVVVGLLVAFFALLANLHLKPYTSARMNLLNQGESLGCAVRSRSLTQSHCRSGTAEYVLIPLGCAPAQGEP